MKNERNYKTNIFFCGLTLIARNSDFSEPSNSSQEVDAMIRLSCLWHVIQSCATSH